MAVPRNRHSKRRTKANRTHYKRSTKQLQTCSSCNTPKLPHNACTACGVYDKTRSLSVEGSEG